MRALVFAEGRDGHPQVFDAKPLEPSDLRTEAWFQKLIFDHPDLLPIEEVDPGAGAVAPLCRELTLPRPQGPVYLDMLGVTRRGRLVLVECKLWRNPQARREVVGQILEYAALLKALSYADLSARVAQKTGTKTSNPLWTLTADRLGLTDESAFVDAVSSSLARGEFDLLLVGDGIRSEIEAVRGYLEAVMGLRARLALIEVKSLWSPDGRLALVPQLAMRTQLVQHRGFDMIESSPEPSGRAVLRDADGGVAAGSPDADINRAFWTRFIAEVRFTHPDQPAPTLGGNNWVRMAMPRPWPHVTAYRSSKGGPFGRLGVFTKLLGEDAVALTDALLVDRDELDQLFDRPLVITWDPQSQTGSVAVDKDLDVSCPADEQLAWLTAAADAFTSMIRARLPSLAED